MRHFIKFGIKNPRRLFLIDTCGAILSSFLLSVVLVKWNDIVGIPTFMLYSLAILPLTFVVCDIYFFVKKNQRIGAGLILISFLNIGYCVLSIGFSIYYYQTLTIPGWIYIGVESMIILFLASVEYKVGKILNAGSEF